MFYVLNSDTVIHPSLIYLLFMCWWV